MSTQIMNTQATCGRGILLMIVSIFCWVTMNTFAKTLIDQIPVAQMVFFRNAIVAVAVLPWLMATQQMGLLKTSHIRGHCFRATATIISMSAIFIGLETLPLSDVVALTYTAPLFITMLSIPFLGETVGPRRWSAIFIGFIGMLIMVRPTGSFEWGSVIVITAAFFFAAGVTITRILSRQDSSVAIAFHTSAIIALCTGLSLPWQWVAPTPMEWGALTGVAVFGALAQVFLIMAIRAAPVSVIAPFDYLTLVFAMGFDVLIWNTWPELQTLSGAGIIVLAGLYIIYRDGRSESKRAV